jgi:hypothetical protein
MELTISYYRPSLSHPLAISFWPNGIQVDSFGANIPHRYAGVIFVALKVQSREIFFYPAVRDRTESAWKVDIVAQCCRSRVDACCANSSHCACHRPCTRNSAKTSGRSRRLVDTISRRRVKEASPRDCGEVYIVLHVEFVAANRQRYLPPWRLPRY